MAPVGPSMTQSNDPELQKESLNIVDEEPTTVMLNEMEKLIRELPAIQKSSRYSKESAKDDSTSTPREAHPFACPTLGWLRSARVRNPICFRQERDRPGKASSVAGSTVFGTPAGHHDHPRSPLDISSRVLAVSQQKV